MPTLRLIEFTLSVVFLAVLNGQPDECEAQPDHGAAADPRVVHRFDFDERADGNLEPIPKYWLPLRAEGFPGFSEGRFDDHIGHSAPPSFHLACNGRNVAYQYFGPDTPVRPFHMYQIDAYVRPDRLQNARTCLSAYFANEQGLPLLESFVRTRFIGGSSESEDWTEVKLAMPAAPGEARSLGLILWVVQDSVWNLPPKPPWHVPGVDVHGGAWWDDITVRVLPRIELSTSRAGNVLVPGEPQERRVLVTGGRRTTLSGGLRLFDADGQPFDFRSISMSSDDHPEPAILSVEHLAPGRYLASLEVSGPFDTEILRSLSFLRLNALVRPTSQSPKTFGVVLDSAARTDPASELALVSELGVGAVKIPFLNSAAVHPRPAADFDASRQLARELVKTGRTLTGVLDSTRMSAAGFEQIQMGQTYAVSTESRIADSNWVANIVAPHAALFRSWQFGADGATAFVDADGQADAVAYLRREMRKFMPEPSLALPLNALFELPAQRRPIEHVCLTLPGSVAPTSYAQMFENIRAAGGPTVSAFVAPLDEGLFEREWRLADFARRVIEARFAGADTVFVPQPWNVSVTADGPAVEPLEEFAVVRTICNVLGHASAGEQLQFGEHVECRTFHEGEQATLVLWDRRAPEAGSHHAIHLGQAERQIDLWGRVSPIPRDEKGRQVLHLTQAPVFVDGVERWLVDFRNNIVISPNRVESGLDVVRHSVAITHHSRETLTGNLELVAPDGWELSRRSFPLRLPPDEKESFELEIRYPPGESSGRKTILAQIGLQKPAYELEVPLTVDVGVSELDVRAQAFLQGEDLVIRHVATNVSDATLHLRSSAQVPGRPRQYRPMSELHAKSTQAASYRFAGAAGLSGQTVRLSLHFLNDSRRAHHVELTIP
jgi:hypothetical protein